MKFRKKPVVIEAFQWQPDMMLPEWTKGKCFQVPLFQDVFLKVKTLEGDLLANPGDWIICGIKREVYPCQPDIFEATYEEVES